MDFLLHVALILIDTSEIQVKYIIPKIKTALLEVFFSIAAVTLSDRK